MPDQAQLANVYINGHPGAHGVIITCYVFLSGSVQAMDSCHVLFRVQRHSESDEDPRRVNYSDALQLTYTMFFYKEFRHHFSFKEC